MSSADVRSLAQLENLRERLVLWRGHTAKELEFLLADLQKLRFWIEEEVDSYWRQQLTYSQRHWNECREALLRCEAAVRADEKRPCTDERKRLEKATQRRALCEQRLRLAKEAKLVWARQINKLRGRMQSVGDMADSDILVTISKLTSIIETLETYARVTSSPGASRPDGADQSDTTSVDAPTQPPTDEQTD